MKNQHLSLKINETAVSYHENRSLHIRFGVCDLLDVAVDKPV